ncbi:sce7726 family protein [Janthinobacterium sp. UMAB-60]|uniref:sce7726 family protein n=1 Tax=Janthinobacterium sp. UMAB-60 TaxID=1365365 RepID=UPI001C58EC9F|nr:sce7726 family protein [Janthinobacterium sp. UMAB-60]
MTITIDSLRLLSRAYTRPMFAELARTGNAKPVIDLLLTHGQVEHDLAELGLGDLFEHGWNRLASSYRNEYVYKNELATRLVFKRHSPRTAGFQVELRVGSSIADVVVANGTTTAYEIKTEFDTCKRLASQTNDYLKTFDKVYVVTHPAHITRYERELDSRVGLIVLSDQHALTPYREASTNIENIDPRTVFRCMRREEYLSAIESTLGAVPSMPNGLIGAYCETLFQQLSAEQAHKCFVKALKSRTTDKSNVDFVLRLPSSLRALGYATPLSGRQRISVLDSLSKPIQLSH